MFDRICVPLKLWHRVRLYAFALVVAVCALSWSSAYNARAQSPAEDHKKMTLELYLRKIMEEAKQGRPEHLYEYQNTLNKKIHELARGGPIHGLYSFSSPLVVVPPTQHPVQGEHPPCGNGKATISDEVLTYAAAVGSIGSAVDATIGAGFIGRGIAAVINYLIIRNNTFQKQANCSAVCTLVPADIAVNRLRVSTYYQPNDHPGTTFVKVHTPTDFDDWRHLEAVDTSATAELEIKEFARGIVDPVAGDKKKCLMRFVCTRLRNWSDDHTRLSRIEVDVDALSSDPTSCRDYSLITRPEFFDLKYSAMNHDIAVKAHDEWLKDWRVRTKSP